MRTQLRRQRKRGSTKLARRGIIDGTCEVVATCQAEKHGNKITWFPDVHIHIPRRIHKPVSHYDRAASVVGRQRMIFHHNFVVG